MKILLISGTNRPGSQTRRLTQFVASFIRPKLFESETLEFLDLLDLPLDAFRPESYQKKPDAFLPFVNQVLAANAMIFVVPEYNGGAPGVLKYFIDLLPFPDSLQRRATMLVGLGAGRFGNLRGIEQIEGVLRYRNAYLYPERTFIPFIDKAMDPEGNLRDEGSLKVLSSEITGFLDFARRLQ